MLLEENSLAPDFSLPDENGEIRSLMQFRGKTVVLYFYPKDDTKGCTTEACNFRDDYSAYENSNVVILGVSPDPPKSHTKFINKYDLPFNLLADEDHAVCELFGVWGTKKMYGREYQGVFRTTYIIDKEGIIRKVFKNVRPAQHSAQVLDTIKELNL